MPAELAKSFFPCQTIGFDFLSSLLLVQYSRILDRNLCTKVMYYMCSSILCSFDRHSRSKGEIRREGGMQVSAAEGHWTPSRTHDVKSSQNVDSGWSGINELCIFPTRNWLHLKDMERVNLYTESGSVCNLYAERMRVCMQRESGSVCGERVCVWRAGLYTSLTSELAEGEAHL